MMTRQYRQGVPQYIYCRRGRQDYRFTYNMTKVNQRAKQPCENLLQQTKQFTGLGHDFVHMATCSDRRELSRVHIITLAEGARVNIFACKLCLSHLNIFKIWQTGVPKRQLQLKGASWNWYGDLETGAESSFKTEWRVADSDFGVRFWL